MKDLIPQETIEQRIFLIRHQKVMIDRDLAELYGVETKHLNRQVKRNILRFPGEFMFQLTIEERSQLVTICHRFKTMKHSSSLPYAFTEHGVAMLASVLKSDRAVKISINIIKTFVKLREMLSTNKELAHKFDQLERKIEKHDEEIKLIFDAIRQLMIPPEPKRKRIGFPREGEKYKYGYNYREGSDSIFRYDNAPDPGAKDIKTFPYHKHLKDGTIAGSSHVKLSDVISEIEELFISDNG